MFEIVILLSLLCVLAAVVAWQHRPADRGQIIGYEPSERLALDYESVLELHGVQVTPDLGPPPPAATLEQHTNRIHIDD